MSDSDDSADSDDRLERQRTSFGAFADRYDDVRPDWPAETVDWLLGSPGTSPRSVLDLGCGTGKGSRAVALLGHDVLGVDPSSGMLATYEASRARLTAEVAARLSSAQGSAEAVPLPDAGVDAVVSFQAWHWFDQDAAARECARVLRDGGTLGLAWHHRNKDVAWGAELSRIVERTPDPHDESEAEQPPELAEFDQVEHATFDYVMRQTVEQVVLHASTWSYVAVSPRREQMLGEVRALAQTVVAPDGLVALPMTTHCHRLRRVPRS